MSVEAGVNALKSIIMQQAREKILAYVFKKVAFLSWGPMGWLTGFIVDRALEAMVEQTEIMVRLAHMHYDINSDLKDVEETIKEIKQSEGMDDEEKKELDRKLKEHFRDLAKFNRGSMSNR